MASEGLTVLRLGIGHVMREIRCDNGLTQIDLAKLANVSQTIVSRVECGKVNSIEHLCNLCDCMNQDIKISFIERQDNDVPS
jgi:predicted transcriptional regulator